MTTHQIVARGAAVLLLTVVAGLCDRQGEARATGAEASTRAPAAPAHASSRRAGDCGRKRISIRVRGKLSCVQPAHGDRAGQLRPVATQLADLDRFSGFGDGPAVPDGSLQRPLDSLTEQLVDRTPNRPNRPPPPRPPRFPVDPADWDVQEGGGGASWDVGADKVGSTYDAWTAFVGKRHFAGHRLQISVDERFAVDRCPDATGRVGGVARWNMHVEMTEPGHVYQRKVTATSSPHGVTKDDGELASFGPGRIEVVIEERAWSRDPATGRPTGFEPTRVIRLVIKPPSILAGGLFMNSTGGVLSLGFRGITEIDAWGPQGRLDVNRARELGTFGGTTASRFANEIYAALKRAENGWLNGACVQILPEPSELVVRPRAQRTVRATIRSHGGEPVDGSLEATAARGTVRPHVSKGSTARLRYRAPARPHGDSIRLKASSHRGRAKATVNVHRLPDLLKLELTFAGSGEARMTQTHEDSTYVSTLSWSWTFTHKAHGHQLSGDRIRFTLFPQATGDWSGSATNVSNGATICSGAVTRLNSPTDDSPTPYIDHDREHDVEENAFFADAGLFHAPCNTPTWLDELPDDPYHGHFRLPQSFRTVAQGGVGRSVAPRAVPTDCGDGCSISFGWSGTVTVRRVG